MTKRKLNRRQQWRIDKIQQERVNRVQRKAAGDDLPGASQLGSEQRGRVVTHFGQQVVVENQNNGRIRCHFRATLEQLVVGDRVIFQPPASAGVGVVSAIEPRTTVLKRPDPYGNLKPVAANIEQMLITFAPLPTPSSQLLDRYLVAAELSAIEPVLVLNKSDLIDDSNAEHVDALQALYLKLGYRCLRASATTNDGLDALRTALQGKTSVFVGQSGVGKSSLINALMPEADALAIGDLSTNSGLGQHTTVSSQLIAFPGGGELIDSPGVREFGLWHIGEEELLSGYTDLAPLAGRCRFRNCSHRHEPGCALTAAAESGAISSERLENFFKIAETLDEESRARY
jgi:ribosome biogenesis GTPase